MVGLENSTIYRQVGWFDLLTNCCVKNSMNPDIKAFNEAQETSEERQICDALATIIDHQLPEAECKIWHRHPVWFLDGNPIVGYSKMKAGIRLMFWSGASFDEEKLQPGTGKFKDASIIFTHFEQLHQTEIERWLMKSKDIQWDYKNVVKRKGKLIRLK
jgi:uncharacterized protein YdhG (YjbR/CyaY superfamily)